MNIKQFALNFCFSFLKIINDLESACGFSVIFDKIFNETATQKQQQVVNKFGYIGGTGPNKWGSLSPNFSLCSHGKSQSPINIATHKAFLDKNLKPLIRVYHASNATLVDNGFNVGVGLFSCIYYSSSFFSIIHSNTQSVIKLNRHYLLARYNADTF